MNGSNDCYVLAPDRSASLAVRFLERFLPRREPSFERDDPSEVLCLSEGVNIDQVLEHLEAEHAQGYSMYFRNKDDANPRNAAVIFNEDGRLFFMLSIDASEGESDADRYLQELQEFTDARFAYRGWEEPPVLGAVEFEERAKLKIV